MVSIAVTRKVPRRPYCCCGSGGGGVQEVGREMVVAFSHMHTRICEQHPTSYTHLVPEHAEDDLAGQRAQDGHHGDVRLHRGRQHAVVLVLLHEVQHLWGTFGGKSRMRSRASVFDRVRSPRPPVVSNVHLKHADTTNTTTDHVNYEQIVGIGQEARARDRDGEDALR